MSTADDMPATRAELRIEIGQLRTEMGQLGTELRTEMGQLGTELRTEMRQLRTELLLEIGAASARTANVVIEQMRDMLRIFDDRYRDLPGRVTALEGQVQQHVADDKRHLK